MAGRRKAALWFVAVLGVGAIVGVLTLMVLERGVEVKIRNSDRGPLHAVVVHVTGRSYSIGDLEPGAVRSVRVNPTGESHIEVSFQDEKGGTKRLNVGGYFERGYGGTLAAEINSEKVLKVESAVYPN